MPPCCESRARRRSRELQLDDFDFCFFVAAWRNSPERQRLPGDARNVVELAGNGHVKVNEARATALAWPDPKPTTADTMVPLPTSDSDGVMLRRDVKR